MVGLQGISIREEENGKTSDFILRTAEKSLRWSNVSYSVLREPEEALCMVLFEARLCYKGNADCWCPVLEKG